MNGGAVPPGSDPEGWEFPSLEYLSQHIKPSLGSRWYDLGVELLGDDNDIAALNEIQCRYSSDIDACCTKMFQLWLGKQQMVSWSHLIESMRHPNVKLHELARKIEQMVLHSDGTTVQPDVLVTVTSLNVDFKNLVLTVSAILDNSTDKYSSLEKCKNYCCSLRTSDNSDQPLFSFESISLIHECTDFSKLLVLLSWHLSWDEHSILTHIVNKCQSVKAREEIENFDKKVAEISERLEITSSTPEYNLPPEFKKICVIINKPFKTLSKHRYEEIKEFVFRQLDTKLYVATSHIRVLYCPFYLEWYVCGQAVPYMINMAFQNKDAVVKEDFVFMQIGEATIFDNQNKLIQHGTAMKGKVPAMQRRNTQTNLPNNAMTERLQKFLERRAKSCLHFFDSINEQSDNDSDHSSSRSSSQSLENIRASPDDVIHDEIHEGTEDDSPKQQNNESSIDESSVLSSLDQQRRFSHYVASSQDGIPVSEIIMKMFDNDDIEGIIPPRFLEAEYPDAIMDNIRKEHNSGFLSFALSSRRSSVDGEASILDVNFVKRVSRSIRVSTATVSRSSFASYRSESFSLDITESLPYHANRLSAQDSAASGIDEDSRTSPVSNTECSNEVFSPSNRRHRKIGVVRSRDSVLQWLANRSGSYRDSLCSVPEEKLSVSGSEASNVESTIIPQVITAL